MARRRYPGGRPLPQTDGAKQALVDLARIETARVAELAESIAHADGRQEVNEEDIERARRLMSANATENRTRSRVVYFGAAALGAGLQGFVSELFAAAPHLELITVWVVLGFLGLAASLYASDD